MLVVVTYIFSTRKSWLVAFYLLMGFLFSINIILYDLTHSCCCHHHIPESSRRDNVGTFKQQQSVKHDIFLLLYRFRNCCHFIRHHLHHQPTTPPSLLTTLVYTCNLNVENWRNSFTLIFSSSLYLLLFMKRLQFTFDSVYSFRFLSFCVIWLFACHRHRVMGRLQRCKEQDEGE